jgi:hypothetical protein
MRRWLVLALAVGALAAAAPPAVAQPLSSQVSQLPVNNTVVPSSQCPDIWQEKLDAGNCTRSACTSTCLNSLAEVPLSCVPTIVEGQINVNTTISEVFNDTQAIMQLCGIHVFLNDTG